MHGVRGIKLDTKDTKGSATIEAAIALPVFLIVIFSIAYIIKIFHAYNTVQASLQEVSRRIANMSYFYHVTGLKDYADQLHEMADAAKGELETQKDTIVQAYDSFNKTLGLSRKAASGESNLSDIHELIESLKAFDSHVNDATLLIEKIISEPEDEIKLFMTIFSERLSYDAINKLVCIIAKVNLASELKKRTGTIKSDAAKALGIQDGMEGISFDASSVFGDTESLDFVIRYRMKAPLPFGFIPELNLSNRVRIIAWTSGRGDSVLQHDGGNPPDTAGESIWVSMDRDKKYRDRGLEIEELYVKELLESNRGLLAFETPARYPVLDAYTYDARTGKAVYYDIFTLNPFMKTYNGKPSAIASEIKRHGLKLREFDRIPEHLMDKEIKSILRIVVMVVPENSGPEATEAFEKARKELEKLGIEVRLYKGYGTYEHKENEDAEQKTAA